LAKRSTIGSRWWPNARRFRTGHKLRLYLTTDDQNAKAALISAVPPLMVKTAANPLGLPKSVFDDLQAQLATNRSQFKG
jgi:hypothetical protein